MDLGVPRIERAEEEEEEETVGSAKSINES
jgi:hypothetical protein